MQGMLEICNMTALNYSQLIINHTTVQLVLCYTLYIYKGIPNVALSSSTSTTW